MYRSTGMLMLRAPAISPMLHPSFGIAGDIYLALGRSVTRQAPLFHGERRAIAEAHRLIVFHELVVLSNGGIFLEGGQSALFPLIRGISGVSRIGARELNHVVGAPVEQLGYRFCRN